jgi:dienelactone hydrolase
MHANFGTKTMSTTRGGDLMRSRPVLILSTLICVALGSAAPAALAKGVQPRFDLSDPQGGPFPADVFTVPDGSQLTGLRVNLPKPNCSVRPSDCNDVDALNQLDGFNLQPRLSIPFTGPIDPTTVSSDTVFLYKLGCLVASCPSASRVGINQVVWDPDTDTLYAESDQVLDQDARYLLVVTNGVRAMNGDQIDSDQFRERLHSGTAYTDQLLSAVNRLKDAGILPGRIAAASIFTTESATAVMEKIRDQLAAATPVPADFALGPGGERTVFPLADVAGITFKRQVRTTQPPDSCPTQPGSYVTGPVALGMNGLTGLPGTAGAVGTIAFGKYSSPDHETADGVIPAVGTLTGTPAVQHLNDIYFNLFLPAGPEPSAGWPVVIGGHGSGGNKEGGNTPIRVAARLAEHGLATITINAVGHGGGPCSTLTVATTDGTSVTLPSGGRGVDVNGDGAIDTTGIGEGLLTAANGPAAIVQSRDGVRQTVVDMMQLVREIQAGIDVNGDSAPDLDPTRIYYFGNSLGGVCGTDLVAVDPSVRAAVLGGTGGSRVEVWRLNAAGPFRGLVGQLLAARTPSLVNLSPGQSDPINPANTQYPFNDNLPPRDDPHGPRVNGVPGAIAIQNEIERIEWAGQSGDPVAYAAHLRTAPLAGVPGKRVLFTFAQGDPVVNNTTTGNVLRAGDLADRTIYFRGLDAYAALQPPLSPAPTDLHEFLFTFTKAGIDYADAGQQAAANFLSSDGQVTIDPNDLLGSGEQFFQTPFTGALP